MKTINKIWRLGLFATLLIVFASAKSMAQEGSYISDQQFYDDLQPYGTWVYDNEYGNVWVPNAEEGFRPYATRGHWVLTDYGNTWVSDYSWGWAPFHYGRWRYDDYYGWEWVPGHDWAPAWVSWRHGGGYYGWAPLTPGISISVSIGGGYHVPDNYWVCAPQAYINRPNIYNYYVPPSRSVTIIRNTTVINNTYVYNNRTYISGPRVQDIRQVTHQNVQVYKINNASRPSGYKVNNNTVNIYRPAVRQTTNARPARAVDAAAYKQQHPNYAIATRNSGGAPAFNHSNAARLATVAKAPTPDNKVVRVNKVNTGKPNIPPGQANNQRQIKQQEQQQAQQKTQEQGKQRTQQQTQQQAQQRAQQDKLKAQQQTQQRTQQQNKQKAQQQAQQRTQEQEKQRTQQQTQQQAQQRAQQQDKLKAQQQTQQRTQQQNKQKVQQQAQQRTQEQEKQRTQQQTQQQAQQQARQRAQQRAQQQAQQQAQQKAQQQAQQRAQQQAQQKAQQQAQQQAQQRSQQQAQQQAQQQRAQEQKQKPHPQEPPKQR
ncbi:MAG TPA: DUF6600 domain-containing protein [Mucilaginibacter sp.]